MKRLYGFFSVAAIVAAAACSGGGEGGNNSGNGNEAPAENQQPAAENVAAGEASPADLKAVMHARHEHYEEMGRALKGLTRELKAGSPNAETIQRHSAVIAGYGPQLLTWFPQGSGPEAGKTRAKAEIWSDPAAFRAIAERFQSASAEFDRAAKSGDIAAVRAAFPTLTKTCSDCHDRFRGPDDH